MFNRNTASTSNLDVIAVPDEVLKSWSPRLDQGFHGIKVDKWVELYLPLKLEADLKFLRELVEREPLFGRVAQRHARDAVERLVRDQHLLPWTNKRKAQFFTEHRVGLLGQPRYPLQTEHCIPVSQIKSLVLMAILDRDFDQARKRLIYFWLLPTVLCMKPTHEALPKRCEDFNLPLDRYSSRHDKLKEITDSHFAASIMQIRRFDGVVIDPDDYSFSQLLRDLGSIKQLKPILNSLEGLILPEASAEKEFTIKMQKWRSNAATNDVSAPA